MKPKKTFQILMVAAALWVMTPGTAEATSISFAQGTFSQGRVIFGNIIEFSLMFDEVIVPNFTVDVTLNVNPNVSLPPGYVCVPIDGVNCISFTVTPSDPNGWVGDYVVTIAWAADTNLTYPNTPLDSSGLGRIRILHFDSSGVTDITTPNSYCSTCGVDPSIGGKDNNFSEFLVAQAPATPVPEPASMVLLGSGLAALFVIRRRRR